MPQPERYFKPADVAKMFDVKPETVTVWIRTKKIRGVKIGKGHYWRIPESAIEELAEEKYGDKTPSDRRD